MCWSLQQEGKMEKKKAKIKKRTDWKNMELDKRHIFALTVILMLFGFVIGIGVGYSLIRNYIEEYTNVCEEEYNKLVGDYNNLLFKYLQRQKIDLNYFNITWSD